MSNRIFSSPRTRRDSEWLVTQRHHSARRGVMSDGQRTNVPPDAVWESINVLLFGDGRKESRSGTRVLGLNMAALPTAAAAYTESGGGIAQRNNLDATKTGANVTLRYGTGGYVATDDVGRYFYWPDTDTYERITAIVTPGFDGVFTVENSDVHVRSTYTTLDEFGQPIHHGIGRIRNDLNVAYMR